jgi:hypothetical protein
MNTDRFDMPCLLERAGFRVSGTRADCIHCKGRSRGTVSFTTEVAFCHRCKWRANTVALAKELGLFRSDPHVVSSLREQARRRARLRAEIESFEIWRDSRICEVSNRYRRFSHAACRAAEVLSKFSECEEAWATLARFYHAEAQLLAAFDWLMFAKASDWLEGDSSPVEIYEAWRRRAA